MLARGSRRLAGRRAGALDVLATVLVLVLLVLAAVGPWLAPHDPYRADPATALLPPGAGHLLGTDDSGRDILSRLLAGTRATLLSSVAVVVLSAAVGAAVATLAAASPRWLDEVIMRVVDMFLAFPSMVLALGVAAALGPSLTSVVVAMVIAMWPATARLVRSVMRETMAAQYVEAARLTGMSRRRAMLRHVLPNSLDSLYVQLGLDVSGAIVLIAGLAFLGVGAAPPSADWGSMVAAGREYVTTAWWVAFFPGAAITVAAVAFGLFGDALRTRLDPTVVRG
ncbi:peptide ABC transporter permease [Luteimicrobium album]|uniref:Peptide ABC transporter permease n=1 Tax=Luteimicrobium album TaxID=1054550 RepID=A0ABQ6I2E8_9MICO|nr:ABC transporter permease [Luteimicrobium album]GMA24113.1 peptide ABC transporter permease [Luteimicrobium album]